LNGIGFVTRAWLVEIIVRVSELGGEFGDKFDANFITTRADGRTKRGEKVGRLAAEFELHATNGLLSDASESAAPPSMNSGDYALLGINEENRYAIGSLHAEQQPRGVCEGGIALWRLGGGLREKVNDVGMELLQGEQSRALSSDCGLEEAAIFCYGFAGIPLQEAKIQNFLSVEDAGSAGARAEAMDQPGNFRQGSELQNLQPGGALQQPRRRNGGTARGRLCVLTRAMISSECFRGGHNLNSIIAISRT
jgi:hypothetical protein